MPGKEPPRKQYFLFGSQVYNKKGRTDAPPRRAELEKALLFGWGWRKEAKQMLVEDISLTGRLSGPEKKLVDAGVNSAYR